MCNKLLLLLYVSLHTFAIEIDPANTLWVLHPIDVGIAARTPTQLALRDIKRDWYKVMGSPPPVVVSDQHGTAALPKGFSGTAFFFGAAAKGFGNTILGQEEYKIILLDENPGGPRLIAALGGQHIRGEAAIISL